ncbi:hypothetical protein E4U13_001183 [Claviceps humidiphila]|uniref:AA1-like domain-containing protein n=1 Tax=Claviceps humidiphila TaxID=1294629 RepID=A0A9P7Q342_9HYPO|nr:hypothetical protein E4U13_001183 [Claviceps humidiphila]
MKASTILSLVGAALVSAAPAVDNTPRDNIRELCQITDFFLQKTGEQVTHLSFKLSGRDAQDLLCSADNIPFPDARKGYVCGDSKYRFSLRPGTEGAEYGLMIAHELGDAAGWWGVGNVPTNCHTAGTGINDMACGQFMNATIGLAW